MTMLNDDYNLHGQAVHVLCCLCRDKPAMAGYRVFLKAVYPLCADCDTQVRRLHPNPDSASEYLAARLQALREGVAVGGAP